VVGHLLQDLAAMGYLRLQPLYIEWLNLEGLTLLATAANVIAKWEDPWYYQYKELILEHIQNEFSSWDVYEDVLYILTCYGQHSFHNVEGFSPRIETDSGTRWTGIPVQFQIFDKGGHLDSFIKDIEENESNSFFLYKTCEYDFACWVYDRFYTEPVVYSEPLRIHSIIESVEEEVEEEVEE